MKKSKKRLTIGILSNSFDYEYQILVYSGVQAAARENDINTIYFSGAEINSPNPARYERNSIYEMISSKNVDGLIIIPTTTCGFLKPEEMENYFNKYQLIPMVSIGTPIKKIPSIIIDNKYGLKILVDHLIETHGYKKFLYIGGSIANFEAIERLEAFKQSLNEHGISIKPEHITSGNFSIQLAYNIVCDFLNRKSYFDAIVTASDNMAIGTIRALQEKKIIIPDETAVTGFDDIKNAGSILTPLTTVRQPIFEMTYKAVGLLIKKINGEDVPKLEIMKTIPIIRRSCGCLTEDINLISVENLILSSLDKFDFNKIKESILNEFMGRITLGSKVIKIDVYESIIEEFFKFIQDQISDSDFIVKLDRIFKKIMSEFFDNSTLDRLFFLLREKIMQYFLNQPQVIIKIENLIHKSRVLINETSKQIEKNLFYQLSERTKILQQIMGELANSFNVQVLLEKMASELPKIGISSCYLSLHSSNEKMFKEARLILAYNKNGQIKLDKNGFLFSSKQLFPRDLIKLDDRYDYIIESLFFEKEQLGFILLEFDPFEGILITSISDQIRSAIKASILMQDTIEKSKKLENALFELNQNQDKLIISEKMASLGRLTAGIAHEMNTPLATARGSLSELLNLINEYKISLSNPDITIEDHYSISEDMIKSVAFANKAIEKASSFIKSIKSQSRKIDFKDKIKFNAVDMINESILLLSHILKKSNLSIDFKFTNKDIALYGLPGKFSQVVTNLVTNAIDAMFDKKGETIKIELVENEKNIILKVEDTGYGIPESLFTKIFDPLFSTKPFGEGTGLGLTIVHEIVYGEFLGYIEVKSKVNSGTIFNIFFNKIE